MYSTSPWVIEEKALAISEGKRLLLFVEEGVKEIGGLQGDYEYISFSRERFGEALIRAVDYVLAVTKVPFNCRVDGNRLQVTIDAGGSIGDQISELRRLKQSRKGDSGVRVSLAKLLGQSGQREEARQELELALRECQKQSGIHRELGHLAQQALDCEPSNPSHYKCHAKCLYERARCMNEEPSKRATLEKARRMFEQALSRVLESDATLRKQIADEMCLVDEAIRDADASSGIRLSSSTIDERQN